MVKLTGIFSQLRKRKVLVVGDFMLDTYTIGKVRRISPEAPVAVVQVQRTEHRAGGAGNVVLNLISLGAEVAAIGRVGSDVAGEQLRRALIAEGVHPQGIMTQAGYDTIIKNRILADNQQIVRVDHEVVAPISEELEQRVIDALPELFSGVGVVAISDYGKGFLSRKLLNALITYARKRSIPVIADPKGIDFSKYSGSTVIKPNLGEAYAAANLLPDAPLEHAAARILEMADADTLMVTRSEAGLSLFHKNGTRHDFPVRIREIKDVTGAGDTVLAMLTCALANGLPITTAAQLSNVAAGIAIERFGCARVSLADLAKRLLEDDVTNKVFDAEHLDALQQVLSHRTFAVLSISSSEGMTSAIFSAIRQLAKVHDCLLLYVRGTPDPEFVSLLASLHDVDFILLCNNSIKSLCLAATPVAVYSLDGGQCQPVESIYELTEK